MSSIQLRTEINTYLDQIDSSFLRVVHSMLSTYVEEKNTILGYKTSGEPLLAEERIFMDGSHLNICQRI